MFTGGSDDPYQPQGMRILFIPLMLMVAVVVALALMSTAPRSSPQSGPMAVQSVR
jgi:hypothetical protein